MHTTLERDAHGFAVVEETGGEWKEDQYYSARVNGNHPKQDWGSADRAGQAAGVRWWNREMGLTWRSFDWNQQQGACTCVAACLHSAPIFLHSVFRVIRPLSVIVLETVVFGLLNRNLLCSIYPMFYTLSILRNHTEEEYMEWYYRFLLVMGSVIYWILFGVLYIVDLAFPSISS